LTLSGNYSWQRSEDRKTDRRIADAPGQKLYLSTNWQFLPDWNFYPQLTWIGSRKRAQGDLRSEIEDYTLVDLTMRRQRIAKHWDIVISMRNIFDEDAREPSTPTILDDIPLEGRSFWGEIRYRF
jgi:iron complex outermembrane receptor protein